ncbi:hypothetical protein C3Y87_20595 [Carbonactinospora thermoautotrophica]|uniref:DUF2273 domain-containing protein n=1 Tax=Carbonactinospora thermoautotrophica TaxID=1469144 RepID=A0A132N645_9ACTN|nr:hypothetical protein TH66_01800 [Carbonactinospora thermoautotrophica]KWX08170.1 hypothetical protein TR74_16200 [Carbonactinospora thermoautotrophica]MCX9193735.1 hypothetical protein [Carbonactinospora thermoautotrophica]
MVPLLGLLFGIALGFAGAFGGFDAFVLVLVLGVLGYLAGRALVGQLDLSEMFAARGRRSR